MPRESGFMLPAAGDDGGRRRRVRWPGQFSRRSLCHRHERPPTVIILSNKTQGGQSKTYRVTDPVQSGTIVWLSTADTGFWVVEPPAARTHVTIGDLKMSLKTAERVFGQLRESAEGGDLAVAAAAAAAVPMDTPGSDDDGNLQCNRRQQVTRVCLGMVAGLSRRMETADGRARLDKFCPCLLRLLDTIVWDLLRLFCARDGMHSVQMTARTNNVFAQHCSSSGGSLVLCAGDVQELQRVSNTNVSLGQALDSIAVNCFTALMTLRHMRSQTAPVLQSWWTLVGFILALTLEERRCVNPWADPLGRSLRVSVAECCRECRVADCLSNVESAADEAQIILQLLRDE